MVPSSQSGLAGGKIISIPGLPKVYAGGVEKGSEMRRY